MSRGGLKEPIQLGNYRLLRRLGHGGMAEVFLAQHVGPKGFAKTVVVKRVLPHLVNDETFVKMFLDEARTAADLSHPNVVQIFDFGEADGNYYMAMEYIPGEDLLAIMRSAREKRQHVPLRSACLIIAALCDGLHYAHNFVDSNDRPLHIVHRDVSPGNVMVSYQGAVKILDFGIVQAEGRQIQTKTGVVKGNYLYMSPEQVVGECIDCRSDVFSAGVLLHDLLTGQRLFKRANETASLMALMEDPIPPPSKLRAKMPPDLDVIVLKALARDPERRFGSAEELRNALEGFLRGFPAASPSSVLHKYLLHLFGKDRERERLRISSTSQLLNAMPAPTPRPEESSPVPVSIPFSVKAAAEAQTAAARPGLTPRPQLSEPEPPLADDLSDVVDTDVGLNPLGVDDISEMPTSPSLVAPRRGAPQRSPARPGRVVAWVVAALLALGLMAGGILFFALGPLGNSELDETEMVVSHGVASPVAATVPADAGTEQESDAGTPAPTAVAEGVDGGAVQDAEEETDGAGDPPPAAESMAEAETDPTADSAEIDPAGEKKPRPQRDKRRAGRRRKGAATATASVDTVAKPEATEQEDENKVPAATPTEKAAKPRGGAGTLQVNCIPWCEIWIDGKNTGRRSPARDIQVPAGAHRVKVVNPPTGQTETRSVEIRADQISRETFRL